jgi:16S rRNA U1498 N3-methylase RsmE
LANCSGKDETIVTCAVELGTDRIERHETKNSVSNLRMSAV